MGVLSYMLVILSTWVYWDLQGFTYFSAGEPILHIKYFEWILGIIGILVIPYYIRAEIYGY